MLKLKREINQPDFVIVDSPFGQIWLILIHLKLWIASARHNFNPLTAKLFNLNFHPLEIVSRWRDPQLQVGENIQIWQNEGQLFSNIADWCHILSLSHV